MKNSFEKLREILREHKWNSELDLCDCMPSTKMGTMDHGQWIDHIGEQLERAQPATPKYDRDRVRQLEREIAESGDNRFIGQPSVAAQGTDGLLREGDDFLYRFPAKEIDAPLLAKFLAAHDAALRASVREETLKEIDQARRIMNTLNFDKYLDAALAHPEKAAQPQTEGKQP